MTAQEAARRLATMDAATVAAALEAEGLDLRAVAMDVFDTAINEQTTDAFIDVLMARIRLPFWLKWIPVRTVLDKILPGALRSALVSLLYDTGGP